MNNAFVLYCEGFGNPQPVVRWLQDGTEIGRSTQLTISSAQPESAGIYSCIIENSLGKDTANARIVVLGNSKEINDFGFLLPYFYF